MSRYHRLGLTVLCVLLGQALAASSASAEEFVPGKWLVSGSEVTSSLAGTMSGELVLENTSSGAKIACSMQFDVTLEAKGEEKTSALLSLSGTEIGELTGNSLLCTSLAVCENGTDVEVWPLEIDLWKWFWELILEPLEAFLLILDDLWHIKCLVLGIAVEEECVAVKDSEIKTTNVTGGVELTGEATPLGNCGTGKENFKLTSSGMLISTPEGTLSGSE